MWAWVDFVCGPSFLYYDNILRFLLHLVGSFIFPRECSFNFTKEVSWKKTLIQRISLSYQLSSIKSIPYTIRQNYSETSWCYFFLRPLHSCCCHWKRTQKNSKVARCVKEPFSALRFQRALGFNTCNCKIFVISHLPAVFPLLSPTPFPPEPPQMM